MFIVVASLLVAGGVLLTGSELVAIADNNVAIMKLFAGTVLLVLVTFFFEQRFRHRQRRAEMDRYFRETVNEFQLVRTAVAELRNPAAEPTSSTEVAATAV